MRNKIGILLMLFSVVAIAQMNLISNVVQPAAKTLGANVSYTNGVYTVPGGVWFKGWEDTATVADLEKYGVINVHLVGDPVNDYTLLPVRNGEIRGALFDKIRQSGTTATLARLIFYKTTNP